MHKIPLGLRFRPRWGSLQRHPYPVAVFKGGYFEGDGGEGERSEGGEEPGPNILA